LEQPALSLVVAVALALLPFIVDTSSLVWRMFVAVVFGLQALPICSVAVLDPRVGHTMDVLSPFISVFFHSD